MHLGAVPVFSLHYFCYTAPLVILAALAVLSFFQVIPKGRLAIIFAGFLLFGVMRVQPSLIYSMGSYYQPDPETSVLDLPRGGHLRIEPARCAGLRQAHPYDPAACRRS